MFVIESDLPGPRAAVGLCHEAVQTLGLRRRRHHPDGLLLVHLRRYAGKTELPEMVHSLQVLRCRVMLRWQDGLPVLADLGRDHRGVRGGGLLHLQQTRSVYIVIASMQLHS